jgi:hypothetical protein
MADFRAAFASVCLLDGSGTAFKSGMKDIPTEVVWDRYK